MFCPQCAREYTESVNFCCQCGTALFRKPPRERKRLFRSATNKKIAGVCGGFAEYLDIDATLVRVVWIMAALLVGWGFLGYLVAWLVIDEGPIEEPTQATNPVVLPQPAP